MLSFLVRASIKCLLLSALLYTVFFVRLGRFTTYEHAKRIAGTNEAHEFQAEVSQAAVAAKTSALQRIGNPAAAQGRH
jgi:hypothetical protein